MINKTEFMILLCSDLDSMDYGKNMQSYIQMRTWFTQLVRVTIQKTGSLLMLLGEYYIKVVFDTMIKCCALAMIFFFF